MFHKLKSKWKVGGMQFVLIIFTFAIGGSLTGYIGRKLLLLFDIENKAIWLSLYILIVTLLWPLMVILISIPFGQFSFFKKYLKKMAIRMKFIKNDI